MTCSGCAGESLARRLPGCPDLAEKLLARTLQDPVGASSDHSPNVSGQVCWQEASKLGMPAATATRMDCLLLTFLNRCVYLYRMTV